jgi:hypothetical protein
MVLSSLEPWMMDKWAWFEYFWSVCHIHDLEAHMMGEEPQSSCAQRMEDVAFGGTLASLEDDISLLLHLDVALGGL